MKITSLLVFVSILFATAGCAVGPLVAHETARTVGKGESEVIAGYGSAGLVAQYSIGLGEDFDIAVHYESLSIGIRAKYAIQNEREAGWSWAVAGGIGTSAGGSHYYGDLLGSYLYHSFEPYAVLRFVHVKTDTYDVKSDPNDQALFTIPSYNYSYGQWIIGTRYWFSKNWLLSLEAASLYSLTSGLGIHSGLLIGAAFGYRF